MDKKQENLKIRAAVLQSCIDTFNFKRYLEVGLRHGENFVSIRCEKKVGVEVRPDLTLAQTLTGEDAIFYMSSDAYFAQYIGLAKPFDLIFVDGDHSYEQSKKDIFNALSMIQPNGIVAAHDVSNKTESNNRRVWQSLLEVKSKFQFNFIVTENSIALITLAPNEVPLPKDQIDMSFEDFHAKEHELFRFKDRKGAIAWLERQISKV